MALFEIFEKKVKRLDTVPKDIRWYPGPSKRGQKGGQKGVKKGSLQGTTLDPGSHTVELKVDQI